MRKLVEKINEVRIFSRTYIIAREKIKKLIYITITLILASSIKTARKSSTQPRLAVLIHTFERYSEHWRYVIDHACRCIPEGTAIYMATDIRSTNAILKIESNKRVKAIYTGEGTFVARARRAVRKIPKSYTHILYLQEDMWLTSPVRQVFLEKTICLMGKYSLSTVKLANSTFLSQDFLDSAARYKNRFTKDFEFFGNSSYCMSHHPSIFHKKYLYLSFCIALIMGRTAPHAHEALISAAVRHYSKPSILINLVTILRYSDRPLIEFIHASEQGKFTDAAIAYMKQEAESPLAGRN